MKKITAPYRNENNQRYSKQLFWEQWVTLPIDERVIEPVFSLYFDREGLINLGREYINDGDPSGYKTSTRIFKDFGYWKHLLKAGWFRDAVRTWDEELEAKLYSEGLQKIRQVAASEDKGALTAARYLADKNFILEKKASRGRPSKDEIEGRLKNEADELSQIQEDAARIRLVK